eukprot:767696-Hanusia_phi.AAC.5
MDWKETLVTRRREELEGWREMEAKRRAGGRNRNGDRDRREGRHVETDRRRRGGRRIRSNPLHPGKVCSFVRGHKQLRPVRQFPGTLADLCVMLLLPPPPPAQDKEDADGVQWETRATFPADTPLPAPWPALPLPCSSPARTGEAAPTA